MASKPTKNPKWSFDETMLALDLYLDTRPSLPAETDARVVALSRTLNALAAAKGIVGDTNFRNPNGVSMKIANLSRLDPEGPPGRRGLQNGSAVEEEVWNKFSNDRSSLLAAAAAIKSDLDGGVGGVAPSVTAVPRDPADVAVETAKPRVWVTGMWGFDPDKHGYVGFTMPGSRDSYVQKSRPGDLVLIVGQRSDYAEKRDVGRVLGLVELGLTPIADTDRMSAAEHDLKLKRFGADKWHFALPIERAWQITREIKASAIIGTTYSPNNARAIGAHTMLLTEREAEAILRLPAREVAVYGALVWNAEVDPDAPEEALIKGTQRGPRPTFGDVTHTRVDGVTSLYVMRLEGPIGCMFPKRTLFGKAVVKVGLSNDVSRRVLELNSGFPPESAFRWRQDLTQRFDTGDQAFNAESALIELLKARGMYLGNEFAIVPEKELGALFAQVCRSAAFLIAS